MSALAIVVGALILGADVLVVQLISLLRLQSSANWR